MHRPPTTVYIVTILDDTTGFSVDGYTDRDAALDAAVAYLDATYGTHARPDWIVSPDDLLGWHNDSGIANGFVDVVPVTLDATITPVSRHRPLGASR